MHQFSSRIIFLFTIILIFNSCQSPKDKFDLNVVLVPKIQSVDDLSLLELKEAIEYRLENFGLSKKKFHVQIRNQKIDVKLTTISNPERFVNLISARGKLDFWETYNFDEVYENFITAEEEINRLIKAGKLKISDPASEKALEATQATIDNKDTSHTKVEDLINQLEKGGFFESQEQHNLWAVLSPNISLDFNGHMVPGNTATFGYAHPEDTATVNAYLKAVKHEFPLDLKFMWTIRPTHGYDVHELIGLRVYNHRKTLSAVGGEVVNEARQDYNYEGFVEITMTMNALGTKLWRRLTSDNIGRQLAITLDGYVYSCPMVNAEIPNGRSVLSGNFTVEEAQNLAQIIVSNARKPLPYELTIVRQKIEKHQPDQP